MEIIPECDMLDDSIYKKNMFIMTNKGLVNLDNFDTKANILYMSTDWKYNLNKIIKIDYKIEKIIILETDIGLEISGKPEQKIMIINKDGNLELKKFEEINGTEYLAISYNTNIYNEKLRLDFKPEQYSNTAQKLYNVEFMNEEIARLFGYIISEGNDYKDFASRGFVHIGNFGIEMDKDGIMPTEISKDIIKICKNLGLSIDHSYEDLRPIGVQINSINFIDFIYDMGYKKYARYKEVPWSILQADKSCQLSFIAALFDGDGFITFYKNRNSGVLGFEVTSEELCKEIQLMLLNMGIVSKIYHMNKKYKGESYQTYRLSMHGEYITKFSEIIKFITKYKNDELMTYVKIQRENRQQSRIIYPYLHNRLINLYNQLKDIRKYGQIPAYTLIPHYYRYGDANPSKKVLDRILSSIEKLKDFDDYKYLRHLSNMFIFDRIKKIKIENGRSYEIKTENDLPYIINGFFIKGF